MEKAVRALLDLLSHPSILERDELRVMISNVVIGLQSVIAYDKSKEPVRSMSPCPCGCSEEPAGKSRKVYDA
jgi:hypothetical protein